MSAEEDFAQRAFELMSKVADSTMHSIAWELRSGVTNRTPYARTRRALMQLIWDGKVHCLIRSRASYRAGGQPSFWSVYRTAFQDDFETAAAEIRHEPAGYRAPAPLPIPDDAFWKLPLYVRVPLWIARYPDGLTLAQAAEQLRSKPQGFVEQQLNMAVSADKVLKKLQRRNHPRDKFEFIYVPREGWEPTVEEYRRPRKVYKKRYAKSIQARIMDFLNKRLDVDGEVLGYTPAEMNKEVDAVRAWTVFKRCTALVEAGDLVYDPSMARSRWDTTTTAYFKLGYRHWLLWTIKQRLKTEEAAREEFGEPVYEESDFDF